MICQGVISGFAKWLAANAPATAKTVTHPGFAHQRCSSELRPWKIAPRKISSSARGSNVIPIHTSGGGERKIQPIANAARTPYAAARTSVLARVQFHARKPNSCALKCHRAVQNPIRMSRLNRARTTSTASLLPSSRAQHDVLQPSPKFLGYCRHSAPPFDSSDFRNTTAQASAAWFGLLLLEEGKLLHRSGWRNSPIRRVIAIGNGRWFRAA